MHSHSVHVETISFCLPLEPVPASGGYGTGDTGLVWPGTEPSGLGASGGGPHAYLLRACPSNQVA
jgi:hypothetical protein